MGDLGQRDLGVNGKISSGSSGVYLCYNKILYGVTEILIMGDFNYPEVDWSTYTGA